MQSTVVPWRLQGVLNLPSQCTQPKISGIVQEGLSVGVDAIARLVHMPAEDVYSLMCDEVGPQAPPLAAAVRQLCGKMRQQLHAGERTSCARGWASMSQIETYHMLNHLQLTRTGLLLLLAAVQTWNAAVRLCSDRAPCAEPAPQSDTAQAQPQPQQQWDPELLLQLNNTITSELARCMSGSCLYQPTKSPRLPDGCSRNMARLMTSTLHLHCYGPPALFHSHAQPLLPCMHLRQLLYCGVQVRTYAHQNGSQRQPCGCQAQQPSPHAQPSAAQPRPQKRCCRDRAGWRGMMTASEPWQPCHKASSFLFFCAARKCAGALYLSQKMQWLPAAPQSFCHVLLRF